jgi:hypothetical protein
MLTSKRAQFTLPPSVTYLNCAYMAPLLRVVEKAGIKGLRSKRNPTGITPHDFYADTETLRAEYAKLINTQTLTGS